MSLISLPWTFTVGAVIVASQHNSNFNTIYNDYNGGITTANISASAGIVDTQLANITTAGKVSGAALTSLASTPSGAGVLPSANGGVPSGCILMWSGTIATIPTGWYLCNGSNGTPDLRNRFIVAADADSTGTAMSTITGSALQTSDGVVQNHVHPVKTSNTTGGATTYVRVGVAATQDVSQNTDNNTGGSSYNIARFYALAFIQKA